MLLSPDELQGCARDRRGTSVGCLTISFSFPNNLVRFLYCFLDLNVCLRFETLIFRPVQARRISAEESRKKKRAVLPHSTHILAKQPPSHPFLIEKGDSTLAQTSPQTASSWEGNCLLVSSSQAGGLFHFSPASDACRALPRSAAVAEKNFVPSHSSFLSLFCHTTAEVRGKMLLTLECTYEFVSVCTRVAAYS